MLRVLVIGWYGHNNLGDELFKTSFKYLWPHIDFHFADTLPKQVEHYHCIFIGGGSLLDGAIPNIPRNIPVGVIGVGFGRLSENAAKLLEQARLVIVRDTQSKQLFPNAILAPDLVFALPPTTNQKTNNRKVTIFLNDFTSPKDTTQHHYNFISEFAKTCNHLIKQNYVLNFVPLGIGDVDDRRIAGQLISRLEDKSKVNWELKEQTLETVEQSISESSLVITQRFHGAVFSTRLGIPFVMISLHDKFRTFANDLKWNGILDYYKYTNEQFVKLQLSEQSLLTRANQYKEDWKCLSDTVTKTFSL